MLIKAAILAVGVASGFFLLDRMNDADVAQAYACGYVRALRVDDGLDWCETYRQTAMKKGFKAVSK